MIIAKEEVSSQRKSLTQEQTKIILFMTRNLLPVALWVVLFPSTIEPFQFSSVFQIPNSWASYHTPKTHPQNHGVGGQHPPPAPRQWEGDMVSVAAASSSSSEPSQEPSNSSNNKQRKRQNKFLQSVVDSMNFPGVADVSPYSPRPPQTKPPPYLLQELKWYDRAYSMVFRGGRLMQLPSSSRSKQTKAAQDAPLSPQSELPPRRVTFNGPFEFLAAASSSSSSLETPAEEPSSSPVAAEERGLSQPEEEEEELDVDMGNNNNNRTNDDDATKVVDALSLTETNDPVSSDTLATAAPLSTTTEVLVDNSNKDETQTSVLYPTSESRLPTTEVVVSATAPVSSQDLETDEHSTTEKSKPSTPVTFDLQEVENNKKSREDESSTLASSTTPSSFSMDAVDVAAFEARTSSMMDEALNATLEVLANVQDSLQEASKQAQSLLETVQSQVFPSSDGEGEGNLWDLSTQQPISTSTVIGAGVSASSLSALALSQLHIVEDNVLETAAVLGVAASYLSVTNTPLGEVLRGMGEVVAVFVESLLTGNEASTTTIESSDAGSTRSLQPTKELRADDDDETGSTLLTTNMTANTASLDDVSLETLLASAATASVIAVGLGTKLDIALMIGFGAGYLASQEGELGDIVRLTANVVLSIGEGLLSPNEEQKPASPLPSSPDNDKGTEEATSSLVATAIVPDKATEETEASTPLFFLADALADTTTTVLDESMETLDIVTAKEENEMMEEEEDDAVVVNVVVAPNVVANGPHLFNLMRFERSEAQVRLHGRRRQTRRDTAAAAAAFNLVRFEKSEAQVRLHGRRQARMNTAPAAAFNLVIESVDTESTSTIDGSSNEMVQSAGESTIDERSLADEAVDVSAKSIPETDVSNAPLEMRKIESFRIVADPFRQSKSAKVQEQGRSQVTSTRDSSQVSSNLTPESKDNNVSAERRTAESVRIIGDPFLQSRSARQGRDQIRRAKPVVDAGPSDFLALQARRRATRLQGGQQSAVVPSPRRTVSRKPEAASLSPIEIKARQRAEAARRQRLESDRRDLGESGVRAEASRLVREARRAEEARLGLNQARTPVIEPQTTREEEESESPFDANAEVSESAARREMEEALAKLTALLQAEAAKKAERERRAKQATAVLQAEEARLQEVSRIRAEFTRKKESEMLQRLLLSTRMRQDATARMVAQKQQEALARKAEAADKRAEREQKVRQAEAIMRAEEARLIQHSRLSAAFDQRKERELRQRLVLTTRLKLEAEMSARAAARESEEVQQRAMTLIEGEMARLILDREERERRAREADKLLAAQREELIMTEKKKIEGRQRLLLAARLKLAASEKQQQSRSDSVTKTRSTESPTKAVTEQEEAPRLQIEVEKKTKRKAVEAEQILLLSNNSPRRSDVPVVDSRGKAMEGRQRALLAARQEQHETEAVVSESDKEQALKQQGEPEPVTSPGTTDARMGLERRQRSLLEARLKQEAAVRRGGPGN